MEQFRLERISGGHTVRTRQGWWQRVWFVSGIPGSTATVARLLGKCSLCKNVGYLSFSIWSVWLQDLRSDFLIASSRNYLAFLGLPFTVTPLLPCTGLLHYYMLGLNFWYYFQAQQHYRAGFFWSSSMASLNFVFLTSVWQQSSNFLPLKIMPTYNLVGNFLIAKCLFLLFFPHLDPLSA